MANLTMLTADDILADALSESISNLQLNISNRFRSKMGLTMEVCVPEILLEGSEEQILTMLESEYTKMLLEVLT